MIILSFFKRHHLIELGTMPIDCKHKEKFNKSVYQARDLSNDYNINTALRMYGSRSPLSPLIFLARHKASCETRANTCTVSRTRDVVFDQPSVRFSLSQLQDKFTWPTGLTQVTSIHIHDFNQR